MQDNHTCIKIPCPHCEVKIKIPKSKQQSLEMNALNAYENGCNALARVFVQRYFPDYEPEMEWVADDIGGVLCVSDFYFGINFMLEAMRLLPEPDILFDFYYYQVECASSNIHPNFNLKNYILNYAEISKTK